MSARHDGRQAIALSMAHVSTPQGDPAGLGACAAAVNVVTSSRAPIRVASVPTEEMQRRQQMKLYRQQHNATNHSFAAGVEAALAKASLLAAQNECATAVASARRLRRRLLCEFDGVELGQQSLFAHVRWLEEHSWAPGMLWQALVLQHFCDAPVSVRWDAQLTPQMERAVQMERGVRTGTVKKGRPSIRRNRAYRVVARQAKSAASQAKAVADSLFAGGRSIENAAALLLRDASVSHSAHSQTGHATAAPGALPGSDGQVQAVYNSLFGSGQSLEQLAGQILAGRSAGNVDAQGQPAGTMRGVEGMHQSAIEQGAVGQGAVEQGAGRTWCVQSSWECSDAWQPVSNDSFGDPLSPRCMMARVLNLLQYIANNAVPAQFRWSPLHKDGPEPPVHAGHVEPLVAADLPHTVRHMPQWAVFYYLPDCFSSGHGDARGLKKGHESCLPLVKPADALDAAGRESSLLHFKADGYVEVTLGWYRDQHGQKVKLTEYAHRIICMAMHGAPPVLKPVVSHLCQKTNCGNPLHTEWASQGDNNAYGRMRNANV
jgi:hypothetical protein